MWIVVTGLMMLAGGLVRGHGQKIDDFGWGGGGGQAAKGKGSGGGGGGNGGGGRVVSVIAGPPVGTVSMGGGGDDANASMSTTQATQSPQSSLEGEWDLACESKRGNHLVFDRGSIREIGNATLFRWA